MEKGWKKVRKEDGNGWKMGDNLFGILHNMGQLC